jgi:hypothetical protein
MFESRYCRFRSDEGVVRRARWVKKKIEAGLLPVNPFLDVFECRRSTEDDVGH